MFLDNKKLLNTILHSKVINSQLEVEFVLSCMGVDSCQSPSKLLEATNRKDHRNKNDHEDKDDQKDADRHEDNEGSSPVPKILQFTQLEESNFKTHFFITRSSFQVIYLFHVSQTGNILIMSETYQLCCIYFLDSLRSFNARIRKYGIQED